MITDGQVIFTSEVRMQFVRYTTVQSSADLISGILNCVCPECGGRMGGRGKEFRCQGECLTDWRQAWERASAESGMRQGGGSEGLAAARFPK
jgi:tRNA(Ile2) C34 agmatinyltransferase TiaS